MKKKLKTAVIGVGSMGANHVRIYSEISNLVAIADLNEEIGRQIGQKFNVVYYQNYQDMLSQEKIDAISVVVPTKYHEPVAINCLKKGIPTLIEKPLAGNIEEAEEIIKLAKKQKVTLMVGHIERFNPAVTKAKKLIEQGLLGQIINLLAIRVGISPPKISNSDVSLDLAIHDIDIFNYLLNELPISKKVIKNKIFKNNIADLSSILLEYKSAIGYIQSNWVTPIKMRGLYITGTLGYLEIDYMKQTIVFYKSNNHINNNVFDFSQFVLKDGTKEIIPLTKKEPLKIELKYFLETANKNVLLDNNYALEALKIILVK